MVESLDEEQIHVKDLPYEEARELGYIDDALEILGELSQFTPGLQNERKNSTNLRGDRKIGYTVQKGSYFGGIAGAIEWYLPALHKFDPALAKEADIFRRYVSLDSVKKSWNYFGEVRLAYLMKKGGSLVTRMLATTEFLETPARNSA